jgi:hypothetical protein
VKEWFMKFHLNKPLISLVASLFALCSGIALALSVRFLPEQESIRVFFVLMPALLLLATLGYILGAVSKRSRAATAGFLMGGGLLFTIMIIFLLPALYS